MVMPRVDCWRLLGISPDADAGEVRGAFARRVQDVHPDTGGTGDGLTMHLLVEARDEALALIGDQQARESRSRSRKSDTSRSRPNRDEDLCYACSRPLPRDQLKHELVHRGFWRRPASVMVVLCQACAARAEERRKNYRFLIRAACFAGLVLAALWLW
jgi:hypothetical protein